MNGYTAIVDYGVGNLRSVSNAMDYLGLKTEIAADERTLERADAIILPGVGAFPDAMDNLCARGLDAVLRRQAERKPLLGICLGMQMLFDGGDEIRECAGLGLIPGRVGRIKTDRKLPHIGWNDITFPHPSPLFAGLDAGMYVYFVHTYCARPASRADNLAVTQYGEEICAAAGHGTVFGCQFHPEKSGEPGLRILKNFGELNR